MTIETKVRVGVIGTTWADFLHLPVLRAHPNAVLAAVCGRDPERTREVAEKHGAAQGFTDYREMLETANLDAVVVASPEDLHAEMSLAAIDAGLHVLCEKPFTFTLAEARELLTSAEAAGVIHQVMFTNRGLAHFRYVKSLLDDGYVGAPFEAFLLWPTGWQPPSSTEAYSWPSDPARSLGMVSELGAHSFDLARWYFGDIVRVQTTQRTVVETPGPDGGPMRCNPDSILVLLEFASGLHATVQLGTANLAGPGLRFSGQTIVVHGREGTLESRCDPWSTPQVAEIRGLRVGMERAEELAPPPELAGDTESGDQFAPFYSQSLGPRQFVDAILGAPSDWPTFADGYEVQRVIDAAERAGRAGQPVFLERPTP